ncbi:MAG: hypothetical protein WDM79_18760 [Terricaulis sp.]
MRLLVMGIAAAALAACATAEAPAGPVLSWGKPNVTLERYWLDSAECTLRGAQAERNLPTATMSMDRQGGPIGMENRDIASDESTISLNDSIFRARQNEMRQLREDENGRQDIVNQCLTERDYRPYRLTADQAARLATLRDGSTQRRRYLHQLGSDPAVLHAQSL